MQTKIFQLLVIGIRQGWKAKKKTYCVLVKKDKKKKYMFKENDKVSAYKISKNNYNLTQFLS